MQAQEIEQLVSSLVARNVTVVEADSDLSNYLTDVSNSSKSSYSWGNSVLQLMLRV